MPLVQVQDNHIMQVKEQKDVMINLHIRSFSLMPFQKRCYSVRTKCKEGESESQEFQKFYTMRIT